MALRRGYFRRIVQQFMDHAAFYFIDETSVTLTLTRAYGRALRGERLVDSAPWRGRQTSTLLAAMGAESVVAPMVFDGAVDRASFVAWVGTQLAPALPPGAVVLMDNASIHKGKVVEQAFRDAGLSVIFTPPYSPDFNPIELFFSKLKQTLRGACARTRDALNLAIASTIRDTDDVQCRNFFIHCGYDSF